MHIFTIPQDIPVFYKNVPHFPLGIKEAFDELYSRFEGCNYYGISHMDADGRIVYKAAVTESMPGEGEKHGYATFTILKGDYLAEKVVDWMSKTDSIKDVFEQLMTDPRFDDTFDCVEWYISDDEMLCMVKCK